MDVVSWYSQESMSYRAKELVNKKVCLLEKRLPSFALNLIDTFNPVTV